MDLFSSPGEGGGTLAGPLQGANVNHWAIDFSITAAETRLCRREVTGKYAMKIVIKHA
jgi:hypothetical protein